ncbi:hypothetical protein KQH51_04790 [bacterium]|nr:hypothetical protein [bacterium]MCB2202233.1 hypothetical protein [bacterium]
MRKVVITVLLISITPVISHAASLCNQIFNILGKTSGEQSVLLFSVELTNECERKTSYAALLTSDSAVVLSKDEATDPAWPAIFLSGGEIEQPIVFDSGLAAYDLGNGWTVSPPPTDSTFVGKWKELNRRSYGSLREFYRHCPTDCEDLPIFANCDARLAYRYEGGLYKNYHFSKVLWYPDSRVLVCVVHQPLLAVGMDSMHGLLIYHLYPEGELPDSTDNRVVPSRYQRFFFDSTDCRQNFVLFDKTAGETALSFYRVDWSGAGRCGGRQFFTLFLLPDRVHTTEPSRLMGRWVSDLFSSLPIEPYITLHDSAGIYRLDDTSYFRVPDFDPTFEEHWSNLRDRSVIGWSSQHGSSDKDDLIFAGVCPEPIHRYPDGLYKNYRIREARYYPISHYLITVTESPYRDMRGRTMDGLQIYKVDGYQWLDYQPCDSTQRK